jgi:hypothetical protein
VGVSQGHGDRLVPHYLFNGCEVYSRHNQMGGSCVPQGMEGHAYEFCGPYGLLKAPSKVIKWFARYLAWENIVGRYHALSPRKSIMYSAVLGDFTAIL